LSRGKIKKCGCLPKAAGAIMGKYFPPGWKNVALTFRGGGVIVGKYFLECFGGGLRHGPQSDNRTSGDTADRS
jgi:hypothetical protein